jgi:ComF family protein
MLSYYLKKLTRCLLPTVCVLCNDLAAQETDLCLACKKELPWIQHACIQCSIPLYQTNGKCGNCLRQPPPFDRTFALFYYKPPIRQLIAGLKFHEKLLSAQLLGGLIADKMASYYSDSPKAEFIIPVPLHRRRLADRGFNQALELGRPISQRLKIPLATGICRRIVNTDAQSTIPAVDRGHNMRNAFSVAEGFGAKHVLLVDDVVTTGSTVSELSLALKSAGVERVEICCVARTVLEEL